MPPAQKESTVRELAPLLLVQNIDNSLEFYRDRLGFEVAGKWDPDGKLAWCRLQRGGSAIMLQQSTEEDGLSEGRGRGIIFYFVCDDAAVMHAEFSGRGVHIAPPQVAFYGMKQIFVNDPDGYELCFHSPTEPA